jgi:acyl dehydratase
MALDPGLVGRSYPPSAVYEVGREKIAEFATALGDPDPLYRDPSAARAAGHPDVIAPPTFAIVLSLGAGNVVVEDPEVGIDYSRVVHGEQRFTHHRPIRAGDRLVATGRIADVQVRGSHEVLVVETRITTEAGEPVCTARSTLVSRGTAERAGGRA